jgi:hypothetical protein
MTTFTNIDGVEIQDLGYGIRIVEDIGGYAVVKVAGKVVKRWTNSREDAYGKAQRFADDLFFKAQREDTRF